MIRGQVSIAETTESVRSLPNSQLLEQAKNFKLSRMGVPGVPAKVAKANQRSFLQNHPSKIAHPLVFLDPAITGLPLTLHNFWVKITRPLIDGYCYLFEAAHRSSPQAKAYEAAVTHLFHEEKNRLQYSNERVRDLDRASLEYAHGASGIAPPITDIKLQVQHAW
jgi:hypothetical protein